jgi:hypothetical protein
MSSRSSSVVSTSDRQKLSKQQLTADDKDAKKKWGTAFRVVQSLNRFKSGSKQRHVDYYINENAQSRTEDAEVIDPVYLALKQATGRYGGSNSSRRGSSAHNFDSASPSPRNLSQVSLQDSGYAEISNSRNQLLGSTPMLDQPGMPPAKAMSNGLIPQRRRAPKLNKQMKSLSLDCAEMPPEMKCSTMRSPFKSKPIRQAQGFATSGETSDWERSLSPVGPSPRRLPPQPKNRNF